MWKTIKKRISQSPAGTMGLVVALVLGTQALFTFCGTLQCPAFEQPEFDAWMPYQQPKDLIFANGTLQDTLHVTETYRSPAEEIKLGYGSRRCNVSAAIGGHFGAARNQASFFTLYCQLADKQITGQLRIADFIAPFNNITDTGITINTGTSGVGNPTTVFTQYYPSLTLAGRNFTHVQVLTDAAADATKAGIKILYIARGQGIVAYQRVATTSTWLIK